MAPGSTIDARGEKLWQWIEAHPTCTLFLPLHWKKLYPSDLQGFKCVWFDDSSLEGFTSNVLPHRARGYTSMTTYKALGLACWMEFKSIGVLGLDNSMFLSLEPQSDNTIHQLSNHFFDYDTPEKMKNFSTIYARIADYFYHLAKSFDDLNKFSGFNIINLSESSFVDAFSKDPNWAESL
jgi:hypothetical protein